MKKLAAIVLLIAACEEDLPFTLCVHGATTSVGYPVGIASDVAVGDHDGDGHLDVLLAMHDGAAVMHGDGRGTLGDLQVLDAVTSERVDLVDLDGDGRLDVVSSAEASGVRVVFATGERAQLATRGRVLAIGDRDGDRSLDVLTTRDYGPSERIVVADFDGDGSADIISTGPEVRITRTDGPARPLFALARQGDLEVADVDGDGHLDVIATSPLTVWRSRDQRAVVLTDAGPALLDLVDWDGDGYLDLLRTGDPEHTYMASTLAYGRGGSSGLFGPAHAMVYVEQPLALASGDLDEDGRPEAIVLSRPVERSLPK